MHPAPFLETKAVESVNVHASLYNPKNFSFLRNAQ
jgi:hypothetical protein